MIIRGVNFSFFKRSKELNRPVIRPEMGPADWLIEAFALIMLGIFIGYVAYHYPKLPGTIPTHFNASGTVDDFGNKSFLLILPGIALFIYVLMTLINRVPHTFNFPGRITQANAMQQYTLATRLIRYLKAVLITLFFFICFFTTRVVFHQAAGLGVWFMPVFLALVFIPIIIYFILATKKS